MREYLIEAHTHVLTSSAAPSVSSVYEAQSDLEGALFIAISQSGKSPDLLAATRNAKRQRRAHRRAVQHRRTRRSWNWWMSPCRCTPGRRRSVAATKSYIASLSCIVQLLANWTEDRRLLATLPQLPELLARAWECDWTRGRRDAARRREPVRGRRAALASASRRKPRSSSRKPAACMPKRSAPPRSSTDPWRWCAQDFPVLMFTQRDDTRAGIEELAAEFASRGARVLIAGAEAAGAIVAADDRRAPGHRAAADDPEFLPHGERAGAGARPRSRPPAASQQSDRDRLMLLAFRNGRMLTDAGIESGKTLLVRDGRIEAIVGATRGHRARSHHRSRRRACSSRASSTRR